MLQDALTLPTGLACDCGGSGCGLRLGTAEFAVPHKWLEKRGHLGDGDNLVEVLGCEKGRGLPGDEREFILRYHRLLKR